MFNYCLWIWSLPIPEPQGRGGSPKELRLDVLGFTGGGVGNACVVSMPVSVSSLLLAFQCNRYRFVLVTCVPTAKAPRDTGAV